MQGLMNVCGLWRRACEQSVTSSTLRLSLLI